MRHPPCANTPANTRTLDRPALIRNNYLIVASRMALRNARTRKPTHPPASAAPATVLHAQTLYAQKLCCICARRTAVHYTENAQHADCLITVLFLRRTNSQPASRLRAQPNYKLGCTSALSMPPGRPRARIRAYGLHQLDQLIFGHE